MSVLSSIMSMTFSVFQRPATAQETRKMAIDLTLVSLVEDQNGLTERLLFGAPRMIRNTCDHRQMAAFFPGDVFGYERRRTTFRAAADWQLFIIRAGSSGDQISRVSGIKPGGILFLSALHSHHARRAFEAINAISERTDPTTISAAFWQRLSTQLQAGLPVEHLLEREVW
jgi:Protein of unknown function (DUF2840)